MDGLMRACIHAGRRRAFSAAIAILLAILTHEVRADHESFAAVDPEPTIRSIVTLDTGDRLVGVEILASTEESLRVRHPMLGDLTLPREHVKSVTTIIDASADIAAETAAGEVPAAAPLQSSGAAPAPDAEPESVPWTGSLELGATGSEGLTRALNGRVLGTLSRESSDMITKLGFRYRYRTTSGDVTANDLTANARNDWLLPNVPWGFFVDANSEYNEFRDYDLRLSGLGGLRYEFIKDDDTLILGRAGLGAAREFGGFDDDLDPEAVLGLRVTHKFNSRLSLNTYGEYFPNLSDTDQFRVIAGAAFEIALNHDNTLKLKAGIEDTYDSDPGRAEPHDVDYYLTIVLSF